MNYFPSLKVLRLKIQFAYQTMSPRKHKYGENLNLYLNEIGKIPLLTKEAEVELAQIIADESKREEDKQEALERFVAANLLFVVSTAQKYLGNGLSMLDLIGAGNEGLIRAVQKFDHTRGVKLISYAVSWIRVKILLALDEQSYSEYIPSNQQALLNKILKTRRRLEGTLERAPLPEEIADASDVPISDVVALLETAQQKYSIDDSVSLYDRPTNPLDRIPDPTSPSPEIQILQKDSLENILRVLETLEQDEREIIILYFGIGRADSLSLAQIGRSRGIPILEVRETLDRAIRRLKYLPRLKILREIHFE